MQIERNAKAQDFCNSDLLKKSNQKLTQTMLPSCHRQSRRHNSTSTIGDLLRSLNWVLAVSALDETVALSSVGMVYLVSCKKKQILSTNIDKKARIMLKKKGIAFSLYAFSQYLIWKPKVRDYFSFTHSKEGISIKNLLLSFNIYSKIINEMDFLDRTLGCSALNTEQSHHQDPGDKHWHLAGKEWTRVLYEVTNFKTEEIVLFQESWRFRANLPVLSSILEQMVQLFMPRQFPWKLSSPALPPQQKARPGQAQHSTLSSDTCPEQGRTCTIIFSRFPHRCC